MKLNMENKIGFLFDLDGVLIDSEPEYSRIWAKINEEYPTGIPSFEKVIKGTTLDKILSENYPDKKTRELVRKRLHELENNMHYEFLMGAENFLKKLKDKNIPIALVTSSDNEKMNHLEEEIPGILDFFDFIVTAELVKTSKPSPEGYLLAAQKLGSLPEKSVVFEDSLQGVMAGKNAGSFVVGIEGTLPANSLKPYSDLIVKSLEEIDLDKLIERIEKR